MAAIVVATVQLFPFSAHCFCSFFWLLWLPFSYSNDSFILRYYLFHKQCTTQYTRTLTYARVKMTRFFSILIYYLVDLISIRQRVASIVVGWFLYLFCYWCSCCRRCHSHSHRHCRYCRAFSSRCSCCCRRRRCWYCCLN